MKAIIPAIDISAGRCVRLTQGDFDTKKVYNEDPVQLAEEYFALGAKRIHIVDLDNAFGSGNNRALIHEICKVTPSDGIIEVGGGVREKQDIKVLLEMGVHRLCLGTILVQDIFQVIHWIKTFGSIFIGSIDVKDGNLHISGWQEEGDIEIEAFLKQIKTVNLCSIEYTNIQKDGMLAGADIAYSKTIADIVEKPVIISGGVGSLEDIEQIMNIEHKNIVGMILGKALFEGHIDLKEALQKYPSPDTSAW